MKPLLAAIVFVFIAAPAWADTVTIKQPPNVYPPPAYSVNPCVVGTSAGISGVIGGVAVGSGFVDEECQLRQHAYLMASALGDEDAARALLCQNEKVRKAYESVGIDCFAPKPEPREQAKSAEELAAIERQIKAQKLLARFREMDAAKQQASY